MTDDFGGELIRERLWFDDGFTTIPNTWARDPHITHQARGLLVQVASHSAGYRITIASLQAGALNGRDSIRTMLDELQRRGYLTRATYREGNLKRYRYRLRDPHMPVGADGQAVFEFAESPSSGFQYTENPRTENPRPEIRSTENPTSIRKLNKAYNPGPNSATENATQPVDNSIPARLVACPGSGFKKAHQFPDDTRYCLTCGATREDAS